MLTLIILETFIVKLMINCSNKITFWVIQWDTVNDGYHWWYGTNQRHLIAIVTTSTASHRNTKNNDKAGHNIHSAWNSYNVSSYGAQYKTNIPYKTKLEALKNDEAGLNFIW